jgi:hypothetical protein
MSKPNPILIEVLRGTMVESRHCGAAAIVDAEGRVVAAWGDIERPVYARSAIKPLQALPLIETGAADRFELGDEEIALACASHSGEPEHVQHVERWLARIGLTPDDLECGAHAPFNEEASVTLLRGGTAASALHNNCSGKHTGFLTTAVHLGVGTRGYIQPDHPVQRYWQEVLAQMSGVDLAPAPAGIDGCGIPVRGLSLRATAAAMAQLAAPVRLAPVRAAAAGRVLRALYGGNATYRDPDGGQDRRRGCLRGGVARQTVRCGVEDRRWRFARGNAGDGDYPVLARCIRRCYQPGACALSPTRGLQSRGFGGWHVAGRSELVAPTPFACCRVAHPRRYGLASSLAAANGAARVPPLKISRLPPSTVATPSSAATLQWYCSNSVDNASATIGNSTLA